MMCVGIALALTLMLLYYSGAVLSDLDLYEHLGDKSVLIASGWQLVLEMWPVFLLAMVFGILLVLVFLKFKKIL